MKPRPNMTLLLVALLLTMFVILVFVGPSDASIAEGW